MNTSEMRDRQVLVNLPGPIAQWITDNGLGTLPDYVAEAVTFYVRRDIPRMINLGREKAGLPPVSRVLMGPLSGLLSPGGTGGRGMQTTFGDVWEFDDLPLLDGTRRHGPHRMVVIANNDGDPSRGAKPLIGWALLVGDVPGTPLTPVVTVPGTDETMAAVVPVSDFCYTSALRTGGGRCLGRITEAEQERLLWAHELYALADPLDGEEDGW